MLLIVIVSQFINDIIFGFLETSIIIKMFSGHTVLLYQHSDIPGWWTMVRIHRYYRENSHHCLRGISIRIKEHEYIFKNSRIQIFMDDLSQTN